MHHFSAQITLDHIRLHAGDTIRDFNSKFFAQHHADETIADQNLMTQADGFYLRMPIDQIADAKHWICEIDEPCIGASLFHGTRNFKHWHHIARRVCESAGAAVLTVWLTKSMLLSQFKILAP